MSRGTNAPSGGQGIRGSNTRSRGGSANVCRVSDGGNDDDGVNHYGTYD